MIRWLTCLLAFVLVGGCVLTNLAWQERKLTRSIEERVNPADRYVDFGIVLRTVVADPNGEELLPGKPRVRVLREHRFGGIVDTRSNPPHIVGPSRNPVAWCCSEDQEQVLLHRDPKQPGQLVMGSEGSGKSTVLAMWHGLRVLEFLGEGREGLQTAPTEKRLEIVRHEMANLFPPSWFHYRTAEKILVFADGTRIRLVSTHQQTKAQGSPVQGFNASWAGRDEGQDQTEAHDDIESRGRSAKNGIYPQLITATNKTNTSWRNLRDRLRASGDWAIQILFGKKSPFVFPSFWDAKARSMPLAEFERRILRPDLDQPPELAVYFGWDRARNLMARPKIFPDVTHLVLAPYKSYLSPSSQLTLVCAHDPGSIYNTTEVLKLSIVAGVPTWCVVGELQTKQTTAREHARALAGYLRTNFEVNELRHDGSIDPDSPRAIVFCDPHGKGSADTDYQTVYVAFQREGLDVFRPAEKIQRSARVGMVNRLLCDGLHGVRLAVLTDQLGQPVAPILVDAFESLEKKPGDDNPEGTQRKDETDKTHAPAALAYGLWPFEQEQLTDHTVKTALSRRAG